MAVALTTCASDKPSEEIRERSVIYGNPDYAMNHKAHGQVFYRPCWWALFPGVYLPYVHSGCTHNEYISLRNRVLGKVPGPTPNAVRQMRGVARRLADQLCEVREWEDWEMPNLYGGLKRLRYLWGLDLYRRHGITKKFSRLSMFVKAERLPPFKINPDPRAIQARHPAYCVAVSKYLKPVEGPLYEFEGDGIYFPLGRLFGKGLGAADRASLLLEKMSYFHDCVVVSVDFSRFDKHVSTEHLKAEHIVYLRKFGNNPELRKLLGLALRNVGRSKTGYRYVCEGGRMSGDMDTALGNCIIVLLMVQSVLGNENYNCMIDGDDFLIFLDRDDWNRWSDRLGPAFCEFGMAAKIEQAVTIPEEVDWCQSHFVRLPGGPRFIRNPAKVVSGTGSTMKYAQGRGRYNYLLTLGQAELLINRGVPILQSFAHMFYRTGVRGKGRLLDLQPNDELYYRVVREMQAKHISNLGEIDCSLEAISCEARVSFEKAFGIGATEQQYWERRFDNEVLDLDQDERLSAEYVAEDWFPGFSVGPEVRL